VKLTVLIPAYNEERTLPEVLRRVRAALRGSDHEIIVMDDASTDRTAELARGTDGVRLVRLERHLGKGAAVRAGLARAAGDVILIQDADLEYDPADYPKLLEPFRTGRARVVYGSRVLGRRAGLEVGVSRPSFYLGGRLLSWLTTLLYGCRLTDEATGYKVFEASLLKGLSLETDGFEFCPEVTAKVLSQGVPIVEVPIAYHPRTRDEGKKIHWVDGAQAIWTLVRLRFRRRPGA
jgi:dolichol-phosphate mannosyltransferase